MAWSRGFFRIWIVLSAIYVLAAASIAATYHTEIKPLFVAPKYEITLDGGTKRTIDTSRTRDESVGAMRFALTEDIATLRRSGRTADALAFEAKFASHVESTVNELYTMGKALISEARSTFITSVLAISLPPAVLFVLGSLVGWIASGFRRA